MTKMNEDSDYSVDPYKEGSWQDRRVAAMNRASFKKGLPFDERNPWFDQWVAILKSKAKSLQEFKKEEWYVQSRKQT